jgi:5-methyltetrahydrofolate--homocysteine methyltransferase
MSTALRSGDETQAEDLARVAIDGGVAPFDLVQKVMVPILTSVGEDFQNGKAFLPELMMAGCAAEKVTAVVDMATQAIGGETTWSATIILGTVEGDMHDIGRDIVASMLGAHGFRVVNMGRNVRASAFLDAAEKEKADIVGLSALMTTTLPAQERTVRLFAEVGKRSDYKLVIGGGATSEEFAEQIGADGYAPDAAAAVDLCKILIGSK